MNLLQLVLINVAYTEDGIAKNNIATGYFVTPDLVLTSNHLLPADITCDEIRFRIHGSDHWIAGENLPFWQSLSLDAALLSSKKRIENFTIELQEDFFDKNEPWDSSGYPIASSTVSDDDTASFVSRGFSGTLYYAGGGGQTTVKRLDLTVSSPPTDPQNWKGISGAPVFVGNKLAGIIRNVPQNFKDRLEGIPTYELLKDAGFRSAIEKTEYNIPKTKNWAVILVSENADEESLYEPADAALKECFGTDYTLISIPVNKALENPGTLLNFVKLICSAPFMFIDATNYQPGIMMLMGMRAVVRRSVTIVVTTLSLEENDISELPFNIQEIKLVSLDERSYPHNNLTAKDRLKIAIVEGKAQSSINPNYLDLPTYSAVRNPVIYDIPVIKEKVLILCSFKKNYDTYFSFLRQRLSNRVETGNIIRMTDINSPQLVGQSLYEHIRWARQCIIDWTDWPPNVFYELGVRLTASPVGPGCLIENNESGNPGIMDGETKPFLVQQHLLLKLFEPYNYNIKERKFPTGIKDYLDYTLGKENLLFSSVSLTRVYTDSIFNIAEKNFDWTQEKTSTPPHISIRNQIEREFGKDIQAAGGYNVLYSSNDSFKNAIRARIREYWLCAWYYLLNRYSIEEFKSDEIKRTELISLGGSVMEALDLDMYKPILKEIRNVIKQLKSNEP